jgi:hypothetical protein
VHENRQDGRSLDEDGEEQAEDYKIASVITPMQPGGASALRPGPPIQGRIISLKHSITPTRWMVNIELTDTLARVTFEEFNRKVGTRTARRRSLNSMPTHWPVCDVESSAMPEKSTTVSRRWSLIPCSL